MIANNPTSPISALTPPSRAAPHDSGPVMVRQTLNVMKPSFNTLPVLTGALRNL